MRKNRKTPLLKRMLIILLSFAVIMTCVLLVSIFKMDNEASVGVFSLVATLVGTVFIAIELKNSQEVSCCEQLVDLNNYFHDNEHLMRVYAVLEKSYMEKNYSKKLFEEISDTEIACYCTFFENLYLLNHHKIAKISDLDDLFGYRFFLLTNNPFIQENYLLPTSSSYTQIFQLYTEWKKFRDEENDNKDGAVRLMAGYEYAFSDSYLKKRLYLQDRGVITGDCLKTVDSKGHRFLLKLIGFERTSEVLALQEAAYSVMEDKSWFFPLSRRELVESMHLDTVAGAFTEEGTLAAFALIVKNRATERSLAKDYGVRMEEALTFDVVVVSPSFRGYGLQKAFLNFADRKAREVGARYILATVDPDNRFSLDNFFAEGYEVSGGIIKKYDNLNRELLVKKIDC